MTPEGRRRRARQVRTRVLIAQDNLEHAAEDFTRLCDEIGIRPPALVSVLEALRAARTTAAQLDVLLSGLDRAKETAT